MPSPEEVTMCGSWLTTARVTLLMLGRALQPPLLAKLAAPGGCSSVRQHRRKRGIWRMRALISFVEFCINFVVPSCQVTDVRENYGLGMKVELMRVRSSRGRRLSHKPVERDLFKFGPITMIIRPYPALKISYFLWCVLLTLFRRLRYSKFIINSSNLP